MPLDANAMFNYNESRMKPDEDFPLLPWIPFPIEVKDIPGVQQISHGYGQGDVWYRLKFTKDNVNDMESFVGEAGCFIDSRHNGAHRPMLMIYAGRHYLQPLFISVGEYVSKGPNEFVGKFYDDALWFDSDGKRIVEGWDQ